ncbi:MAG: thioredoxin family protein [Candidatus Hydrogenedentes bacterium]|nr:thioredoxin family protein [Candidatus Hydrogenedentota bacterium]
MHTKEARNKFREADQLFREKKFPEALAVLDDLDKEFPDTKNVLYPRAMCLARVGRFEEALELCRQLKVEFGDPRGEKLMGKISALRKARIEKEKNKAQPVTSGHAAGPSATVYSLDSDPPQAGEKNLEFSPVFNPSAPQSVGPAGVTQDILDLGDGSPVIDMAALDDLFAPRGAPISPPIKVAEPTSRTGLYIGVGIAVAVLLGLIAIPLLLGGQSTPATSPTASAPEAPAEVIEAPPIDWLTSFEAAVSRANEDGSPVLLFFYSGSAASPEVTQMDDYVWSDPSVRNLAKDWVCARVDVDSEPELEEQFELSRLPTTVLTSYYFEETDYRQEGSTTAQDFYSSIMAASIGPHEEPALPPMPVIAMVMLPILLIIATFVPLLVTLLLFGKMPEQDPVSGTLGVVAVGLVAPVFGRQVLRSVYQLDWTELIVYYVLFAGHLFVFNAIMTRLIDADMPFWLYVYAQIMMR